MATIGDGDGEGEKQDHGGFQGSGKVVMAYLKYLLNRFNDGITPSIFKLYFYN
jgi:hypothetical protein